MSIDERRMLTVAGVPVAEIEPTLVAVRRSARVACVSPDDLLNTVARVVAAGRLTMEVLNMLHYDTALTVWDLARYFDVSTDAVQEAVRQGDVDAEMALAAMFQAAEERDTERSDL
ncbi:hypothetical protein [Plantibacter sp. YIM 135249]|uniref:hypothetical protein n=1 Tax=Plantibacter sp. YIM 135249 TaxID=3423918 RepID=UPI003D337F0E